jgi:hypothetical protein
MVNVRRLLWLVVMFVVVMLLFLRLASCSRLDYFASWRRNPAPCDFPRHSECIGNRSADQLST